MITTLILDWGGVLTMGKNTDSVVKLIEERYNLGNIADFIDILMVSMDSGKISTEEYCAAINKEFNVGMKLNDIENIFENSVKPNESMVKYLPELKSTYRLVLLSNNNPIMISVLRSNYKHLLDIFEKVYFSSELRMRKPDREIYEYVLRDLELKAEECVFVDDRAINIKASEEIGMTGIVFDNFEQFRKDLDSVIG